MRNVSQVAVDVAAAAAIGTLPLVGYLRRQQLPILLASGVRVLSPQHGVLIDQLRRIDIIDVL
jgi:hypothetical protein